MNEYNKVQTVYPLNDQQELHLTYQHLSLKYHSNNVNRQDEN